MIITFLFGAVVFVIDILLSLLPDLVLDFSPFSGVIDIFFSMLSTGAGIFFFFVPKDVVLFALPAAFMIYNFELMYDLIMWVARKLPFINIH